MKKITMMLFVSFFILFQAQAQTEKLWTAHKASSEKIVTDKGVARLTFPKNFDLYDLNIAPLRQLLFSMQNSTSKVGVVITLPNADGKLEQFQMYEASNFDDALQARFPEIRAYSGRGITDKYATLKLSISPQGIQTMIFRTDKENEFIEPYSQDHTVYAVFKSQREKGKLPWTCATEDHQLVTEITDKANNEAKSSAGQLKTMRLAQSCNGEYANYFGATSAAQVGLVLAAYNATLTRCNGVYEKDLALHLNLVNETTNVIYYTPGSDPYSTLANWNTELQRALNTTLTGVGTTLAANNAAYDIGHMFGASGGGGNAGCIGCPCVPGVAAGTGATKGRGITSPADGIPQGDNFDIDFVAHEIGHQLGGNHTFSNTNEGAGVSKEVGSGITIMGYAGITAQDIAPHSIDVFHETTIAQIQANLAGKACPITTPLAGTNATPVVAPIGNFTIPISTPFELTGSATDADAGDALTYSWEQNDDGGTSTGANSDANPTKTVGPNFISFKPTASPSRYFPRIASIVANSATTGCIATPCDAGMLSEALSSVARTLNFRLTVRDNVLYSSTAPITVGQTSFTDMRVTVAAAAGPFVVTAPNTAISWIGGSTQNVTWNVAGTTANGVNAASVDIFLSTDGGFTYPIQVASQLPNNGTASITVPNNPGTTNRIMVKGFNHIFFDISNTNFTITGPSAIATTVVNETCSSANGSITLGAVTGGASPYTYSFNGSPFTATTSYPNLAAGVYSIVVRDANGSTYTTSVTITNTSGPATVATSLVNATCGSANGSITIGTVTGGTAPYTYSFDGSPFTTTLIYTGLLAGSYPLIVKDANGCIYNTTVTIIDNPGPTAIATTITAETCGSANGSVNLGAVTGGVTPFTYDFNSLGYSATSTYTGLTAGTYNINVKDNNGCIYTTTVTITNTSGPTAIATTITDAACGANDGSVTIDSVTDGTAPYTYDFNSLGYSATTSYSALAAGSYTIDVKDANGCIFSTTISISNASGVTAVATTSVNETCSGSNGSITIDTVTGGTAPYTYNFNNTTFGAVTTFTGLPAGCYSLDVQDANGCIFSTSVCITNSGGPTAVATTNVNTTCGAANGSITLGTVTGGTAPYTYNFDNLGHNSTTTYTGLVAGCYPLEVQDANGCIFSTSVCITNSSGPTAVATTNVNTTCGASNGSITIDNVTGGTAPYTYNFNNLGFSTFMTFTALSDGCYSLDVKDANGCVYSTSICLTNSNGPTAVATTNVNTTCGATNGCITITGVTGGTAPYTYSFNNAPGVGPYTSVSNYCGLLAGCYPLEVKDANGCIFSTTVCITDTPGPTAITTTVTDESCGGANGCITITGVTGGPAPYTYDFNGAATSTTTTYCGLTAGTYTITAHDANGCTYTTTVTIINTPAPTANISYAGTPFSSSDTSSQPVTLTGTGAYTGGTFTAAPAGLTIDTITGDIIANTSTPGCYTVSYLISGTGGCPDVSATTNICITTLGTDSFVNNLFSAYPNPTTGLLMIALKDVSSNIDLIIVTDVLGKTIQYNKVHTTNTTIDLSSLSNGLYFVKVKSGGLEKVLKIIKE